MEIKSAYPAQTSMEANMVLYSRESSFAFVVPFVGSHAYIRVRVSQESHESEAGFAA